MSILLNVFDVDIRVLRATVCSTYNMHIIYHADKHILEFSFVIFLLSPRGVAKNKIKIKFCD